MPSEIRWFLSGGAFVIIIELVALLAAGSPQHKLTVQDMQDVNAGLHQDLRACRDTILSFERFLQNLGNKK